MGMTSYFPEIPFESRSLNFAGRFKFASKNLKLADHHLECCAHIWNLFHIFRLIIESVTVDVNIVVAP